MTQASDLVELRARTALITGAAKRIGAAVSLALARAGVNVLIHHRRSAPEAEAVAAEARQRGVEARVLSADLSNPESAEALFDAAAAQGPVDFLINSASVFSEQSLAGFTAEDLQHNLDINTLAPLTLSRRFAAQGRTGAIVNFLDTMIDDYDRRHVPYHLSKQMLFSLTRMMAVDFAPRIRVNAVAPGLILPPDGQDLSYLESLKASNPLQRYGSPDGICEAVLFLLKSGFVTGQVIYVDGGRHMRGNMYG